MKPIDKNEFTSCEDCEYVGISGPQCGTCIHNLNDHFKPKSIEKRIINLSKMIGSDIDMEFKGTYCIRKSIEE